MLKISRKVFNTDLFKFLNTNAETSKQKTLSLTFGFFLSLFPVFGLTTLLCFVVSMVFRLNHFLVQGMNIIMSPLHLLMMYPFLTIGRLIFFNDKIVIPEISFKNWLIIDGWPAFYYLFECVAGGIAVWGITSLITFPLVHKLVKTLLKELQIN